MALYITTNRLRGYDDAAATHILQCDKDAFYTTEIDLRLVQFGQRVAQNIVNINHNLKHLRNLRELASQFGYDLGDELDASETMYHEILKMLREQQNVTDKIYNKVRQADKALDLKMKKAKAAKKEEGTKREDAGDDTLGVDIDEGIEVN